MNQLPHSGPTNGRRHLARCICAPLVSVLRVGQVCDVISRALSLQPPGHGVGDKFIAVQ